MKMSASHGFTTRQIPARRMRRAGTLLFLLLVFLAATLSGCYSTYRRADIFTPTSPALQPPPHGTAPTATFLAVITLPPAPTATLAPTASLAPTVTPSPEPLTIRFAVIGDYGQGEQGEADVAALVKSWQPEIIITTGDNNYPDGEAATIDDHIGQFYSDYIYPYQGKYGPGASENRFFPTLGNHDYQTPGAQPYLDYFTLPGNERYYDFTWGPVHFFAVNSDSHEPDGVGSGSIQGQWLQERLAASTLPWKVVYFHQPPYSSGLHGSIDWIQWPFARWGATATIGGHDHVYERLLVDGIPYFVNGLGGGPIYYFNTPLPESQVRYAGDYGAMLVNADEHSMQFQFYTRSGELIDSFVQTK